MKSDAMTNCHRWVLCSFLGQNGHCDSSGQKEAEPFLGSWLAVLSCLSMVALYDRLMPLFIDGDANSEAC